MAIVIKSDKKWRTFKYGYELPKKWRKEFDWLKGEAFTDGNFAYYRKWYYALDEFLRIEPSGQTIGFRGWDGYISDTYGSGTVIKISSDGNRYKIGHYYVTEGHDEHAPDVGEGY